MLNLIYKKNRSKRMVTKMEKRTKNNAVYGKILENLKNRIDVRLASNEIDYLKWTSKPRYMSQKILDDDLVAIRRKEKLHYHLTIIIYQE